MRETLSLRGKLGAYVTHSRHDGRDITRAARAAAGDKLRERLLDEVDPHRRLDEQERERRLDYARRAYFARLALASARARRAKKKRSRAPAGERGPRSSTEAPVDDAAEG